MGFMLSGGVMEVNVWGLKENSSKFLMIGFGV